MRPLPRIGERGALGLVLWLRQDQPAIYSQLVQTVPEIAQIETLIQQQERGGLGWIAQAGAAIANFARAAMPKIVAALPQIASTAVDVAGQVYAAKAQKKLIDSQIKQAEMNQQPLPTVAVPNQQIALTSPVTGAQVTQPAVLLRAQTQLIPGVPDGVTYAGGAIVALLLLKRFRVL